MSCSLADVALAIGPDVGVMVGDDRTLLAGMTHDSRAVEAGWLFACVPGANVDGHDFAPAALDGGAAAFLCERALTLNLPQLVVPDVRAAMGPAAAEVHQHPSRDLTLIGVTGTNGKSSVVQLLADLWGRSGRRSELYGTLTGARTTAEAPDLQRQLRASADQGVEVVAMEVSSHAIELGRVAGTRFAAVIFTNLGRDHLDFHGTIDAYFEAKAGLFRSAYSPIGVVNLDDTHGLRLASQVVNDARMDLVGYRLEDAEDLSFEGSRSRFRWRGLRVDLPLAGRHNVSNALAAAATAEALGLEPATIVAGLEATAPVRGRFETVDKGQPFEVAVDYAHTPDALAAVLGAARQVTTGRVIVVFGCGGDRDRSKRGEMGRVAQSASDVMVITSDNPRSEDPLAIIDDILGGTSPGQAATTLVEVDRRQAIGAALAQAGPGDLVLVAGKGHETTQEIGDQVLEFDDRQVVLDALEALS